MFKVSRNVNYLNFGFMPNGRFLRDLYGKMLGHPNLIKRLTARDIMRSLDVQPTDAVLDFGCGSRGFFTVEIAKIARRAVGLDVDEAVRDIPVPASLDDRLEFVCYHGEEVPFEDDSFDVILASEVFAVVPDPRALLREWVRLLKPGGRLLIVNGTGREQLRRSLERPGWCLRMMKRIFKKRWPWDFDQYLQQINEEFGNKVTNFYDLEAIENLVSSSGFKKISVDYTGAVLAHDFIVWRQFLRFLRGKPVLGSPNFFPSFHFFTAMRVFEKKRDTTELVYVAQNTKEAP